MKKIGRNDPCPSGSGEKFKKCLAAHPCLASHSSAADIWWVCERWQAQPPGLLDLRAAMTAMKEFGPAKLDAFLDIVFDAPPSEIAFWRNLIIEWSMKEYPDLPALFQRVSAHLSATGHPELPSLYSAAAHGLREFSPEMYSELLAATLALDPATTPMESLETLVEWTVDLDRMAELETLRQRFPEFPEYLIEEPEEEATAAESDEPDQEPEPDFPPEVHAKRDKAREDFEKIKAPSLEQAEAFVEELLALPHEATLWNEVFSETQRTKHPDAFKIFHRLAAALSPAEDNKFAFVCWAAVEEVGRIKRPERLPEIARALLDFNPQSCDPDALSHIADALLAHGFVNETIELMAGFFPTLRDPSKVMPWVAPRVAEDLFHLRLGALIVSGDFSRQPIDQTLAGLLDGLDEELCENSTRVPLQYLVDGGESFSREQFVVLSSTKDTGKQRLLWNRLQKAFVEVARDEWLSGKRDPSVTLIGLHMILRAVESWVSSPREKGQKHTFNLLDYLNSAAMDRLVPLECGDFLGIRRDRARVMCDACISLIRWSGRQGLLTEAAAEMAGKQMTELIKVLGD